MLARHTQYFQNAVATSPGPTPVNVKLHRYPELIIYSFLEYVYGSKYPYDKCSDGTESLLDINVCRFAAQIRADELKVFSARKFQEHLYVDLVYINYEMWTDEQISKRHGYGAFWMIKFGWLLNAVWYDQELRRIVVDVLVNGIRAGRPWWHLREIIWRHPELVTEIFSRCEINPYCEPLIEDWVWKQHGGVRV